MIGPLDYTELRFVITLSIELSSYADFIDA